MSFIGSTTAYPSVTPAAGDLLPVVRDGAVHTADVADLVGGIAAEVVNEQSGTTYTVATADRGRLLSFTSGSAVAVDLPQAGTSYPAGFFFDAKAAGAGAVTITPTTSTIDGAASITLAAGQSVRIVSDGTNYVTALRSNGAPPVPVASGGTGATTASGARTNLGLGTAATLDFDTDGTLAANSDSKIATQKATVTYVAAAVAALVNSSPSALDTLKELADALGDDPNFAATMATALGLKAPLASPALTGTPTAPTAAPGTNTTQIATTAFVAAAAAAAAGTTYSADETTLHLSGTTFSVKNLGIDTAQLAARAVTLAKLVAASATQRLLLRKTAGSGDWEEGTASDALDFLGTTRGAIAFRGASGWELLAPGTAGYVLTSNGAGADPSYQAASGGGGGGSSAMTNVYASRNFI